MIKVPCKGCKDRLTGCHATCKKYIEYKAKHAVESADLRRQIDDRQAFRDYKEDKVRRLRGGKHE